MTPVRFFISLARFCGLELPTGNGDGGYGPASAGRGRGGGCLSGECSFFLECCAAAGNCGFFSRLAGVFVTGFSLSVLLELWGVKLLLFIDDVSCFDLGKVLFVYVIVVEGSNGYGRLSEWVCLCFMGRRSRGLFGLISWRRLRLGNYGFFDLILMECCWLVCLLCKEHLMVGMLRFLGE